MCLYLYFLSKCESEHIFASSVKWENWVSSQMICDRASEHPGYFKVVSTYVFLYIQQGDLDSDELYSGLIRISLLIL